MRQRLFILILLTASSWLHAFELPTQARVPGGIAHIPFSATDSVTPPRVTFNGKPVMVVAATDTPYAAQHSWVALVGIPLSTKAGDHQLKVGDRSIPFEIKDKRYREQRIKLKNKRHVNPQPLDMVRINREKKEILGALAAYSETSVPVTRFDRPAPGPFSSPFGLRRFFNDQPRKPHSGLDIAAPRHTPIAAPAPGVVVATGEYFFNGRTVILDHGRGLTSLYCHMETIDVALGDRVETGQPLGSVGSSGRATGPHLHWTVSLNDARIDPLLMLDQE